MNRPLTRLTLVTLLLFAALAPSSAFAESRSATMQVSAVVLARAIVDIDEQPQSVTVTANDVLRGYVDVASPLRIKVRTNARGGYLLHMVKLDENFTAADLSTGNLAMQVRSESVVSRPYVQGGDVLTLTVRLQLAPAVRAGVYAFPVAVDATPL